MRLKIEKLVYEGKGLGRDKAVLLDNKSGKAVFVRKSVPGDELDVEITKDKKSFSEGIIKKIVKPSPKRIEPRCPHFDRCGGCDHQNILYTNQLKFKEEIFRETLARAGIETEILPIRPGSDSEFYYRNVSRFFFTKDENGQISFAMHDYADYNKLIPIKSCLLQSETCNQILSALHQLLNSNLTIEQSNNLILSLWQIRIREGKNTGEFMVEIITKTNNLPLKNEIVELLKTFSMIKSCYHATANRNNSTDAKRRLLFGSPIIYEKIGKFTFQISPESFFQTNSLGVKTLYDQIKDFANVGIGDNILDLYCGTGTIGIYLSTLAKKVIGVEKVQSAINDAKANARINNVKNCEFVCADATKWLDENFDMIKNLESVKIILDPPRDGLNREIIQLLCKLYNFTNFQLIYVSCNPSTFARDIKIFEENGLKLKKTEPLDMFPQTHHIECLGLISR